MRVNTLGRIVYIEPNDLAEYSGVTFGDGAADNVFFNAEEYNCFADLQIVVPNRSDCGRTTDINGINVSISGLDSKKNISFFEGKTLDVDAVNGRRIDRRYLTTDYTECSYKDILNGENKENLGIKSIDVQMESYFYPQVTINFTDIRAASLMTPSEIEQRSDEYRYNFFKSVFHFPYPKFLLTLKGFYGTKVTFKLAVNEFKSRLNADTGNYDVTITFIGYMYGLYTDIPFNYLLISPYIGSAEVGKPNQYWLNKVSEGVFVFDNKAPILTFIEYNDKFQRVAENVSKKTDLLTDSAYLQRYDKDKTEIDEIDKLLQIYDKFISSINVGDSANVKVITNKNLYFIGTNGINDAKYAYINKNMCGETLYNALISFNERHNSGVESINGTDYALDTIDLCNEPLYIGDSINPSAMDSEWYRLINSETLSKGEDTKLSELLYMCRKDVEGMKWCIFDSSHFLSVFNSLRESLCQDIVDCEGLASTEASKIVASELTFTPTVENVFRMIFAHVDTFMHFMYDVIEQVRRSGRKMGELGLTVNDSDMPRHSTKNTFVPPFPLTTETNGSRREWVYPGELNGMKNSPEVRFISDIVDATLMYRRAYNAVDDYARRMSTAVNNSSTSSLQRFIPLMISDIHYQGNNPYSYLNDSEDIDELIYLYTLRYKAACLTNWNGFFDGTSPRDDCASIAEIEAENAFMAKPSCSSDYLWKLKGVGSTDGFITRLKEYAKRYNKQTVNDININSEGKLCVNGNDILCFDNVITTKVSKAYYLTEMSVDKLNGFTDSYFGVKEGIDFELFINDFADINKINNSLDDDKRLDTSKDILNSVECIKQFDANNFLNASDYDNTNQITKKYLGGIYENNSAENTLTFKHLKSDDYLDMLSRFRAERNAFDFNFIQSGKETDTVIPNLFIMHKEKNKDKDVYIGGDILNIFSQEGKALLFLACLPRSSHSMRQIRKYLLGEGDKDTYNRDLKNILVCVPKFILLYAAGLLYRYERMKSGKGDIIRTKNGSLKGIDAYESITDMSGRFSMNSISEDFKYKDIAEDFCLKIDKSMRTMLLNYFTDWANGEFKRIYTLLSNKENYKYTYLLYNNNASAWSKDKKLYYFKIENDIAKKTLKDFYLKNVYVYVVRNEIPETKALEMSDYNIKGFVDKLVSLYSTKNKENETSKNDLGGSDVSVYARLSIYMTLKKIYDNWLCGVNGDKFRLKDVDSDIKERKERFGGRVSSPVASSEFNNFLFTDSFSNDLSNKFVINPKTLYDMIKKQSSSEENSSVYQFIQDLCSENKLIFLALPTYNNYRDEESIKKMFLPQPSYEIGFNNNSLYGDTYVVCYMHEVSSMLDSGDYEEIGYDNDGYDIADSLGNFKSSTASDVARIFSDLDEDGLNMLMPAFGVTYGRQNQSLFKNVTVNMDGPKVTDYSIANMFMLGKLGAKGFSSEPYAVGQDMYAIYSNRSYTCTVEMMGCANIMPFMYFQLNNVPMFRGAYIIVGVSHNMTPGSMTTKFTGVRVCKNGLPFNSDVFNIRSFLGLVENYINKGGNYGAIPLYNYATPTPSSPSNGANISKDEKALYVTDGVGMDRIGDTAKFTQGLVTQISVVVNSGNGEHKTVNLTVNKALANDIKAIFNDILATDFVIEVVGCYSHRTVQNGTNTKTLSYHSYGVAIDLNPRYNGFINPDGKSDDNRHIRTNNHPVVKIFKNYGWGWGGNYSGKRKDYMHFSYFDGK